MKLEGPSHPPLNGDKPTKLVVMLHGVGSNGDDLIGLVPYLGKALPHVGFFSPNAPYPYDMAPVGYQWFSLADRSPSAMLAGAEAAAPLLQEYIDMLLDKHGLQPSDLALLGFSQGTMMSLYSAPRMQQQIAGVVGFSGALLGATKLREETKSRPPILLVHGQQDDIVPVSALHAAVEGLQQAEFSVQWIVRPGLPHSIDAEGLNAAAFFLAEILPR